jgi:DNA-binding HxlR family transcriptional regulator
LCLKRFRMLLILWKLTRIRKRTVSLKDEISSIWQITLSVGLDKH